MLWVENYKERYNNPTCCKQNWVFAVCSNVKYYRRIDFKLHKNLEIPNKIVGGETVTLPFVPLVHVVVNCKIKLWNNNKCECWNHGVVEFCLINSITL